MRRWIFPIVAAIGLGACAGPDEPLVVKQFQLRDTQGESVDDPMARGEKQRRLHGAVSMAERRDRLGQYYTVLWQDAKGAGAGDVTVTFDFQQGGTGSRVKTRTATFDAAETSGRTEFNVIGDDYFKGGRVLAWKVTLKRGSTVLATKQSYLWR